MPWSGNHALRRVGRMRSSVLHPIGRKPNMGIIDNIINGESLLEMTKRGIENEIGGI